MLNEIANEMKAVSEYLVFATSDNNEKLALAGQQLGKMENEKFPQLCLVLSHYLVTVNNNVPSRQMAGLFLKNIIFSKDDAENAKKQLRWAELNKDVKDNVKSILMPALKDDLADIRSCVAHVMSKIMIIDLAKGIWVDCIPLFLSYYKQNEDLLLKQMALATIGYICEDLGQREDEAMINLISPWSDDILFSLLDGLTSSSEIPTKRTAAAAIYFSLEFYTKNFQRTDQGSQIIAVLLQAISAVQDKETQLLCLSILIDIASLHYEILKPSMEAFFQMTMQIFKSAPEEFVKLALEFWVTIAKEEDEILDNIDTLLENELDVPKDLVCENYVAGIAPVLTPLLLECLTKHEDDYIPDSDERTLPVAASACLCKFSDSLEDEILPLVLPFIEANLNSTNWKLTLAALMALGSILEGPDPHALHNMISQTLPILVNLSQQKNLLIQEAALWALGGIADLHYDSVRDIAEPLIQTFIPLLEESPRISHLVCELFEKMAVRGQLELVHPFDSTFNQAVTALFAVTNRSDGDEENLAEKAYDALEVILASAPDRTVEDLQVITNVVFQNLASSLQSTPLGVEETIMRNLKISHLIVLLQVLFERIGKDIIPNADDIVKLAITVLESKTDSSVHDEVYLLISGLANILEDQFTRYLQSLYPYILAGMKNWKFVETCVSAIHLVGDISRAIDDQITCVCDELVTVCLELIMTPNIPEAIKTSAIALFGDLSLAVADNFTKYLGYVLPVFKEASEEVMKHRLDIADEDDMDTIHAYCLGLVEGFQGLLQGVGQNNPEPLRPLLPTFIALLAYIAEDTEKEENISRGAVGLIGDMLLLYGASIVNYFNQPFVKKLLKFTEKQASDTMTFETVVYARDQLLSLGNIRF